MKVLIKNLPVPKGEKPISVNKTLKGVDKNESNVEAEKGEMALGDMDFSGFPALFDIAGHSHAEGGTHLNLPDQSFIFSKDKSMKIKDEGIQKEFNKPFKKSGYVPADLAKKYDINNYRKILADPNSDKLQRETAELMIKNYNEKLGKLALVQESIKGFPQGVPFVSMPYMESMGIDPSQLVHGSGNDNEAVEVPSQQDEDVDTKKLGGTIRIKITGLPKLQKGGPILKKKQESVYNQAALDNLTRAKEMGLDFSIPGTVNDQMGAVDKTQGKLPSNVYGRKNWSSAELFPDFANRTRWYLNDHPDFDPRKKEDVKNFQKAYNQRLQTMGFKPELTEDAKFGEHTYSVYDLNKMPAPGQADIQSEPAFQTQPALQKPNIGSKTVNQNNPFWTEDAVKLAGAYGDYAGIKKYMPWQAGYSTQLLDPTYYDPTRELAASAEQGNIASQALSTFAGPQEFNSRFSEIQGKGLESAANILGKYNNMNVSVANTTQNANVDIMNQDSFSRAGQATGLYDKTVRTNQNFDNAKNMAKQNIRQDFIDAWTNRGKTQALNSMNKQYKVDPVTGFVEFTGVPGQVTPQGQQQQVLDYYNQLMENPNLRANPEHANQLLKIYAKSIGIEDQNTNDFNSNTLYPVNTRSRK